MEGKKRRKGEKKKKEKERKRETLNSLISFFINLLNAFL